MRTWEKQTLSYISTECIHWYFLYEGQFHNISKSKIHISSDPIIPLLDIYPRDIFLGVQLTYAELVVVVLFVKQIM